jgi:hypothetical protein
LLGKLRAGDGCVLPTFIDDYLDRYGTFGEVRVKTGAWNTGWHDGHGFVQWTGSGAQKHVLERIALTSRAVHDARWTIGERFAHDQGLWQQIEQAMWHLLRAETSCNIYWGEAWVARAHRDLDACWTELNAVQPRLRDPAVPFVQSDA